jgi:hypothetical protein
LRQRQFDLQDRELIAISRLPVPGGERMRQQAQSFAQQRIDLLPGKSIADGLQPRRIRTGEYAVVQCLILSITHNSGVTQGQ